MKAINFPEANQKLAENQPEYETLPVHVACDKPKTYTACFQLTEEEINMMYTDKAMKLYDRACKRLEALALKMFDEEVHICCRGLIS